MADNSMSPAEAALNAFLNGYICKQTCNVAFEADRNGIAAALRAVAHHLQRCSPWPNNAEGIGIDWCTSELHDIAAELEGKQ